MASSKATEVFIKNHKRLVANTLLLTVSDPTQRLPASAVPDSVGVLVKSDPGNPVTSIILVDGVRISPNSYPLVPNEEKVFYVDDTSEIWVGSRTPIPANGLLICFIHESDEE